MGKLKFTISNIIYLCALLTSILLLENVGFLTNNLTGGLNDTHFFMLFTMSIIGYLSYFLLQHIKNKVVVDYVQVAGFTILFATGLISIWGFRDIHAINPGTGYVFDYSLSAWDKVRQSLSLLVFVVTLYATLFHFNRNYVSNRRIIWLYIVIVIFVYVAIIYSIITEYKVYFINSQAQVHFRAIHSFFWDANMFSGMILMGMLCCIGINYFRKNVLCYLTMLLFFFVIVVVGSLNAITVSFSVLIIYSLLELIFLIKRKYKLGIWSLAIFLIVISSMVILFALSLSFDFGKLSKFCASIHVNIINAQYKSLTGRTGIWSNLLKYLINHPFDLCFGLGKDNASLLIGSYILPGGRPLRAVSAHNGFFQILTEFGLAGLILYVGFIFYFIYCGIRLMKKDVRFALSHGLIGAAMVAYSMLESFGPFIPNTQGILVGILFFMPMLNRYKHNKHPELCDDIVDMPKVQPLKPRSILVGVAIVLGGLLSVSGSLFVFKLFRSGTYMYVALNIFIGLFILSCFLPFIISSIYVKGRKRINAWFIIVNALLIAITAVVLTLLYLFALDSIKSVELWLYPILLLSILLLDTIYIGIRKRRKASTFFYSFIAFTKNVFAGVIAVFIVAVITFVLRDKMDLISPLTYFIYAAFALLIYFLAVNIIPFKENKIVINHLNDLDIYSLHKSVVKDRLGEFKR